MAGRQTVKGPGGDWIWCLSEALASSASSMSFLCWTCLFHDGRVSRLGPDCYLSLEDDVAGRPTS